MNDKGITAGLSRDRIGYLDSARGLAALSVVVWHYFTAVYPFDRPSFVRDSPFHFFWYGDLAVTFFFIHSGFILTYRNREFCERITGPGYLSFLIRRMFRIYPLYLFILLLSHLVAISMYPLSDGSRLNAHFHEFWRQRKDWMDVLREALLVVRIPGNAVDRYIPQDWTLSVELIVSPALPLLSFLSRRRIWLGGLVVLALAKVPGLTTYILEFGTGVLIFHTMEWTGAYWQKLSVFARGVLAALSVVLMSCIFHFSEFLAGRHLFLGLTADRLIVVGGCALAVQVLLHSSRVHRILSIPLLARLGEACYGLYLLHFLFLIAFADPGLLWLTGMGCPLNFAKLVLLGIIVVLASGMSFLLHYLIEGPMNGYGKRLARMVRNGYLLSPRNSG